MINNSWPNPYNPTSLSISFIPDKIYPVFYYVLSLLWVLVCLSGFVYSVRIDYIGGISFLQALDEMVFPIVLLFTWLLPTYFLGRYIQKLEIDQ